MLRAVAGEQAFSHYACLYIKYLQIFRKLETCYDCMIHPQKRIDVKSALELVIKRIVELKHELVLYNPRAPKFPAAKEYIHLVDILVDLKLSTDALNIPIPTYFREDSAKHLEHRDKMISGYMLSNLNVEGVYIPDYLSALNTEETMSLDQAIEIIQRNERGRQGIARALKFKEVRDQERRSNMPFDGNSNESDIPVDLAATSIQKYARGVACRKAAIIERENELKFVGMLHKKDRVDFLREEAKINYIKKKQQQAENKGQFERGIKELKDILMLEEGPDIKERLREERTLWITDQIAQEKFPENLADFGKPVVSLEDDFKADAKDAKVERGDSKKGAKGGGKSGSKEDKSAKNDEVLADLKAAEKAKLLSEMSLMVNNFEKVWATRDERNNFVQSYDTDLAKEKVMPEVMNELRAQVDALLEVNLQKIAMQLAPMGKKKKGKGKKGKNGKKGKDKKKKGKPLPGEKIAELKSMDIAQMLSLLIDAELVVNPRPTRMTSLMGDFTYLDKPRDPSFAQLRQSITEYCILPNGSEEIKRTIGENVKSVLLYGPTGSGKTLSVEAVATELGAMLFHLSPEKLNKLKTIYPGKSGATKLVHMVFMVARHPVMQPAVIYLDDCEEFFTKKSKDKEGPVRFKKDLQTYKNQAINNEHRVVIMGTTRLPEKCDAKESRAFFDKFLYFPYPDYSARVLVWNFFFEAQLKEGLRRPQEALRGTSVSTERLVEYDQSLDIRARSIAEKLDVSSLAFISEGYSVGAIVKTIKSVVTSRRVAIINHRPLTAQDFIDSLSTQEYTYENDKEVYLQFGDIIGEMVVKGGKKGGGKKGGDKKAKKK